MGIRSIFTPHPEAVSPAYRYGMLIFILVMLAWQVEWYVTLRPDYDYDPYGTGVVLLMALLGHLASAFKWPKRVTVALCVLALSWSLFGLFYLIYLSPVLYPSPP